MAIKIYDNYFSLIIKVDSIKRIYGENNFGAFLKEFFPKPVEKIKTEVKKKDNWFKSLFSKPQITYIETIEPKEVCTLDDYSFMQGAKKFNHITSIYGHDGNLVFISCFQEDNIYAYCDLLDKKGFYGYKSTIYIENVDYVIFEKNGFPISVQWLETIEEDKGSEITSPSHIYSISPFKQPIRPMSFPSDQGGIGYDTELQWDLCQKHIQDKKFSCFTDLIDINIIYDNCSIAHKLSESRDDWFILCEGREVFGNKILNKIEYIIWWECTLKTIKERGDTFCSYYTHTNVKGIACSLNGLPKSIRFSIEDGLIISAKEFWKL